MISNTNNRPYGNNFSTLTYNTNPSKLWRLISSLNTYTDTPDTLSCALFFQKFYLYN